MYVLNAKFGPRHGRTDNTGASEQISRAVRKKKRKTYTEGKEKEEEQKNIKKREKKQKTCINLPQAL